MKPLSRIAKIGDIIFITQVTRRRHPIFADEKNIKILFQTLHEVQCIKKCNIFSFVIMPDHMHLIIRSKISLSDDIMNSLKINFFLNWKKQKYESMQKDPASFWQRRHYEHVIWNEKEFLSHINYVYNNPVKHGYVESPDEWPYSSFSEFSLQREMGIETIETPM